MSYSYPPFFPILVPSPPSLLSPSSPLPPLVKFPSIKSNEMTPPPPSSSSSSSVSSILIIVAILVSVAALAISIHLLLRLLSHRRRRHLTHTSSSPPPPPPQFSTSTPTITLEKSKSSIVDRLPLFSLSSALARQPKSSPDCAICQSPFLPDDTLRLLPACRHAFHSLCIDPWILTSPTCPLCRSVVTSPPPPSLLTPSNSFRVQPGRVSSRRTPSPPKESTNLHFAPPVRSYDLGASFEYLVDEEVDAVVEEKSSDYSEDYNSGNGARSVRLRDYVDRFTRSASTSFSSLRFSGRFSNRFEDSGNVSGGWDLEGSARRDAEGLYGLYRWVVGAY